jgi:hypothetical protein
MKSRESVASCCEGKSCASSRRSRKPAFQLQEGRVNPAQTLQEFEQIFSKKKLERPKARLPKGIPTLGCAAFYQRLFSHVLELGHQRRAQHPAPVSLFRAGQSTTRTI